MAEDKTLLELNINIPFPSKRLAEIAYDVLRVDAEPKRSGVSKKLSVDNNLLKASFTATQAKQLRVGVNGFFDNVMLISETVKYAGAPVSERYSHYLG